jgi:uncharacterized membrane protein YgdD (TMEM256/DUF423 family)
MKTKFIPIGAVLAFLAVALGAFGAHGLKGRIDPDLMAVYHTGVLYHMMHALGLILLGMVMELRGAQRLYRWSAVSMLTGTILFSGSLYLLAITGTRWLGAITPLGGVLFLLAWSLFAIAAWKHPRA